jgi:hypothetical protein
MIISSPTSIIASARRHGLNERAFRAMRKKLELNSDGVDSRRFCVGAFGMNLPPFAVKTLS